MVLTKTFGIFENLMFLFKRFVLENVKFTIVAYGEIKDLNLIEQRAIVEQRRVKFGTRNSSTYMGHLWPSGIQGHFVVIRCTFEFS